MTGWFASLNPVPQAFLAGTFAWAVTALGAASVFLTREFNRKFFDYLEGDDCFMEFGTIPRLAREGELVAYKHEGFFFSMDTYRDYKHLNDLCDKGQTPWIRK